MDVALAGQAVSEAVVLLAEARAELEQWHDHATYDDAKFTDLDAKVSRATVMLDEARLALDRATTAFPTGFIPITRARGWGGRRERF